MILKQLVTICKKKLASTLTLNYTQNNSKCITDLNLKHTTLKLLEYIGEIFVNFSYEKTS